MDGRIDFSSCLKHVRKRKPLVHHITNYVTAADCANAVLAAGGVPVMADAPEDVDHITGMADSLVLNLGTMHKERLEVMLRAIRIAKEQGIPVVLDPVGCGASLFRLSAAQSIIDTGAVSVIRGNVGEMAALVGHTLDERGVESGDSLSESLYENIKAFAKRHGLIAAATGKRDTVTDGQKSVIIYNGCKALRHVTGGGCMVSSLCGAFCGASPSNLLEAVSSAVVMMGLAGEIAWKYEEKRGLGHFHMGLFDAIGNMTGKDLMKGAAYEEMQA
ncbi:MAG: hydroxyethylthiazole kinase [Dialister sp.]|nr:hydroxyethylthiazole kinase [Dialister sp.]